MMYKTGVCAQQRPLHAIIPVFLVSNALTAPRLPPQEDSVQNAVIACNKHSFEHMYYMVKKHAIAQP